MARSAIRAYSGSTAAHRSAGDIMSDMRANGYRSPELDDEKEWQEGTAKSVIKQYNRDTAADHPTAEDIRKDMKKNGYQNPELGPLSTAMSDRLDELNAQHAMEREQRQAAELEQRTKYYNDLLGVANPDMGNEAMVSYAQYKNTQGAQLASYDAYDNDGVKKALSEINNAKKDTYLFNNMVRNPFADNSVVDRQREQFKEKYGVDDSTLKQLENINYGASLRDEYDEENGDGSFEQRMQDQAADTFVRTQKEELAYAQNQFTEKGGDNAEDLRSDIQHYEYVKEIAEAALSDGTASATSLPVTDPEHYDPEKVKEQLMDKYGLSEDDFEDLIYYGGELDDYEFRQKQQAEAQANVNTGNVVSDVAGGFLNSATALAVNPIAGAGSTLASVGYKLGFRGRDKHSPLNTNSDYFKLTNAVNDYQGATEERISGWNKIAGMAYSAAMSAAESAETSLLAPFGASTGASIASKLGLGKGATKAVVAIGQQVAGLTPFAANAFGSAISNNVSNGMEMDEAFRDAAASTAIEVITEIASLDKVQEIAKGNSRLARNIIVDFAVSSIIEGTEEMAGDVLELGYDFLVHGNNSDFNKSVQEYMNTPKEDGTFMTEEEARKQAWNDWKWQVVEDGVVGAMSGAMGGAGATIIGRSNAKRNANELFGDFTREDYAELAAGLDTGVDAKQAQKNTAPAENTDENGVVWTSLDENNEDYSNEETNVDAEGHDGTEDSHQYLNKSAQESMKKAKSLAQKYAQQDKVSDRERLALYYAYNDAIETEGQAQQDKADKEYDKALKEEKQARREGRYSEQAEESGIEIPDDLKAETNDYTAKEIHKRMASAATFEELSEAVSDGYHSTNENTRTQTRQSLNSLASMLESKGIATQEQIDSISQTDQEIVQKAFSGEEVSAFTTRQQQLANYGKQQAIEVRAAANNAQREQMVKNAATIKNEGARKLYTEAYQTGMNATLLDRAANTVMAAGRNGMPLTDAMDKIDNVLSVIGGNGQKLRTDLEGMYTYSQKQAKDEAIAEAKRALREQSGVQEWGSGKVTDNRSDNTVELPEMRMLEFFAQASGLDYVIGDNQSVGEDSNGEFKASKSTIYLNADQRGQLAYAAIHELVEFDAAYNQEETATLVRAFNSALMDSLGVEKYNHLRSVYKFNYANEMNKTELDLDKEILADMAPTMFTNKKSLKKFVNELEQNSSPQQARTIKEKLADWFHNLADALRDFLSEVKPTKYQQQVAEANIQNIEELRDMLVKTTAHAINNYQQARMEALAETLGVNAEVSDVIPEKDTIPAAFQAAYDNFVRAANNAGIASNEGQNTVDNNTVDALIDATKELRMAIDAVGDPAFVKRETEAVEGIILGSLNEKQSTRVIDKSGSYQLIFEGAGTSNIAYDTERELEGYEAPQDKYHYNELIVNNRTGRLNKRSWIEYGDVRTIHPDEKLSKLASIITNYEQKYGVTDGTVKGYLDVAKTAVNDMNLAIREGRIGVGTAWTSLSDGNSDIRGGVVLEAGSHYTEAMRALREYSKKNVEGFNSREINTTSMNAAINKLARYQTERSYLVNGKSEDVDVAELFGSTIDVRNSKVITEPAYDDAGTFNIAHREDISLGEYSPKPGEKAINVNASVRTLIDAINAYEKRYGVLDVKVQGYLDYAKRAVNDIIDAVNNGYAGVKSKTGVVNDAGNHYRGAMRALRKYAISNVQGFDPAEMDNQITSDALSAINRYQARRELVGEGNVDAAEESYRLAHPFADMQNAKLTYPETIKEVHISADEMNRNADGIRNGKPIGDYAFYGYEDVGPSRKAKKDFTDKLNALIDGNGVITNDYVGEIQINNTGSGSFLAHSNKSEKGVFWGAIPSVLKHGRIIAGDQNHKGNIGQNTIVLAAMVNMTGESGVDGIDAGTYYVAVALQRAVSNNGHVTQSFHAMDFATTNKIERVNNALGDFVKNNKSLKSYDYLDLHKIVEALRDGVNIYEKDNTPQRLSRVIKDIKDTSLTEGQQEFYADESPLLMEDGKLKRYYHGTSRMDRVGTVFRTDRATSGPMAFFTDDQAVAASYARDKTDTSLAYDERYDSYGTRFRLSINGQDMSVEDAWSKLPVAKRAEIQRKAAHVTFDENTENIIYDENAKRGVGDFDQRLVREHDGNYLAALRESWLDNGNIYGEEQKYLDVLNLVGLDNAQYLNPDYRDEGVYEVYLHVTNPLNVAEIPQKVVDALQEASEAVDYDPSNTSSADMWDKNNQSPATFMEKLNDDISTGTTRAWTSIPDWVTSTLKDLGYDGITDVGGKYGGNGHQVVIPFESNQVKSVDNENPSEDVDIRRSMNLDANRNMNNEEISANRDEVAGILEKGADALKGTKVNEDAIRNIALDMKRKYSSAIDTQQFTDNLTKLFGYLHSGKTINYNDFVAVMQDVARPAIDAAYTSQASREDFAAFRNGIDGMTFSLTEEQRKTVTDAFGSMKTFEDYYPEIHITEDGKSFAEQWSSLMALSGGLLDENIDMADMPTALVDAMEALRPSMNNWEDNTQAAHDMALDIIGKYLASYHDDGANKAVINEFVKSAERDLTAKHKEWKAKAKANYDKRLREELAYQNEVKEHLRIRNRRKTEQIAKLKAKNATRVKDIRERQKKNNQLRQINKTVGTLYQYMANPTDQNHVPKDLQETVMQFMSSLDMSTPAIKQNKNGEWTARILESRVLNENTGKYSYTFKDIFADTKEEVIRQYNEALESGLGSAGARKWYDRMSGMSDMFKIKGDDVYGEKVSKEMSEFLQALDRDLASQFDEIIRDGKASGKASINDLTSDQLRVVNAVTRNVLKAINGINKLNSLPSETVSGIANDVMEHADTVNGRKNMKRWKENLRNFFSLSNATPETYFHAIGADKVVDILINAQNQKAWRLREAQEYNSHLLDGFTKKEIKSWDKEQSYLGGKVKATKAQMMTLYELLKRPDAQLHLLAGGFKVGSIGDMTTTQNRVIHLTMEEYDALINEALTDREKAVADGMQRFMANNCSAWGNETSMQLYGYEKFLDDFYWPMTVDKTSVNTNTAEMMGGVANTIKNMGMTKATVSNASNALVLNGAMDVYAKHISDMAVYGSWAAPIQDLIRFFNYRETEFNDDNGQRETYSTKEAIEQLFGTGGTDYFKKLMASIQGTEQSSFEDPGFITKLTGATKKAAVLGNVRVMVQQPTAIVRAATMIDGKYLIFGSAYKAAPYYKEAAELRDRSSATFWLKNQGNIDGQITQSLKSQITGVQSFGDTFAEKTGVLAGKADEITWAAMYRAVFAEQADKLGKDKIGTKEFEDAVNSRFDHVMLRTQVYDGTITRSQFMRSNDKLNVLQSAFMAEPVKTYNVVLRDIIDYQQSQKGSQERRNATKAIAKDISVLYMTAAVNALAQSLWDAFRNAGDPDEDDGFWARVWDAYFGWDGNLVDNMKPWNWIPVIGDWVDTGISGIQQVITGKSQWTSSSDLTTSGAAHVYDAAAAAVKYARAMSNPAAKDKSEQTLYGVISKINRAASDVSGMPVYAIQRDTAAVYNTVARNVAPLFGVDNMPLLYKSKTSNKSQTKSDVYETIRTSTDLSEVKAAIDEAVEHHNTYDGINDGLKKNLQEDLIETYKRSPSEATKMINRIAEIKAYCSDKEGSLDGKTHSEKVEYYKKNIKKWLE